MKLSVLMTVYNEADFIEYAIEGCIPYVDHLVIVEGAYKEKIRLGCSPRSTDGTVEKITKCLCTKGTDTSDWIEYINANEESDRDQRNVGWRKIKELNPDGFLLIIDGDEVYQKQTFDLIYSTMNMMRKSQKKFAYFNSLTFVNDFNHYTNQYFPRLFDLQNSVGFFNDNHMQWSDKVYDHSILYGQGSSPIKYHHYSFVKGAEKFNQKRNWWMSRGLGKGFDYGWKVDENGQITDKNHRIFLYTGKHPSIMNSHPMMQGENKNGNKE
ncbi:MAG: hypothetical protein Q7K54_03105 [Candidatus Parcubacteria bacterium]|nr:hypothetical protein [Candidatus Parcubacteria bacterium]